MSQGRLESLAAELLTELLREYSPSFHERRAVSKLKELAENSLSYDEVWIDPVGNFYAKYGGGGRSVALIGHVDTVAGEIPVKVEGGFIFGRGSVDAKGPLVAALIGASLAKELVHRALTVYVVGLVGEEGPSHGAWYLVNSGLRFDFSIICEPTNTSHVVTEYYGSAFVEFECRGEKGHLAAKESRNACVRVVEQWIELAKRAKESNREYIVSLVRVNCGSELNVVPESGRLCVNFRIPASSSLDEVVDLIESSLLEGCRYRVVEYTRPVKASLSSAVVRALARAISINGLRPVYAKKLGTSDMNVLYGRVCNEAAAYGPGDPKLSHTNDEKISVADLVKGIQVYRDALIELSRISSGSATL